MNNITNSKNQRRKLKKSAGKAVVKESLGIMPTMGEMNAQLQQARSYQNLLRQDLLLNRKQIPKGQILIPNQARQNQLPGRRQPLSWNALGDTEAGRAWVKVLTDPCGEDVPRWCGVTDETQATVVCPFFRDAYTIRFDVEAWNTPITPPTPPFNWDCQLWSTPYAELPLIYRIRVSATSAWSAWVGLRQATAPLSITSDTPACTSMYDNGISSIRAGGKGVTVELNAPSLANQGQLYMGMVSPPVITETIDCTLIPGTGTGSFGQIEITGVTLPLNEDSLTQMDPKHVQHAAKLGGYQVMKMLDPKMFYVKTISGANVGANNDTGTAVTAMPSTVLNLLNTESGGILIGNCQPTIHVKPDTGELYNYTWPALNLHPTVAPTFCHWGVGKPMNLQWGAMFFMGISSEATIKIKSHMFVEGQLVAPSSGASGLGPCFALPSPSYDPRANNVAAIVGQEMPHSYPASYNSFGTLLKNILRMAPGVARFVGGHLQKWGVPVVPRVLNHAAKVVDPWIDVLDDFS